AGNGAYQGVDRDVVDHPEKDRPRGSETRGLNHDPGRRQRTERVAQAGNGSIDRVEAEAKARSGNADRVVEQVGQPLGPREPPALGLGKSGGHRVDRWRGAHAAAPAPSSGSTMT